MYDSSFDGALANSQGIALDGSGEVYPSGSSQSSDFPLASAYDDTYAGGTCGTRSCYDAFVFHLDLATNTLIYTTYPSTLLRTSLGGSVDEEGLAMAASSSGSAYVTGYTKSTDFPVLDAIQGTKGAESCAAPPCEDAFVTKLDASGSALAYSTYPSTSLRTSLGGGGDDQGNGIALDGEGGVYVAGEGNSVDFPVTPGAYDTTPNGTKDDAFIVKIGQAAPPPSSWTTTYTYTYDPFYRLVEAAYSSGEFFEYTYDAVGNRLSETTHIGTITYAYDNANRLTDVNGVAYTWDDNGNLLSDGVNTYTYDHANQLTSVVGPSSSSSFAYNGLGDRLQQTVDSVTTNYTLDLNNWLTKVLADGTNTYLYGAGRIAQYDASGAEYFLADALGLVRQLADSAGGVQLSKVYEPFGEALDGSGKATSRYGFAGEWVLQFYRLTVLFSYSTYDKIDVQS